MNLRDWTAAILGGVIAAILITLFGGGLYTISASPNIGIAWEVNKFTGTTWVCITHNNTSTTCTEATNAHASPK